MLVQNPSGNGITMQQLFPNDKTLDGIWIHTLRKQRVT